MTSTDEAALERIDLSAPEFLLAQLAWIRDLSIDSNSAGRDFAGALDGGQYGMAYVIAHQTLRRMLSTYLRSKSVILITPEPARLYELLAEYTGGTDSDLYQQAWELECANPETGGEVVEYIERWTHFVSDILGLAASPTFSLDYDDALFANYYERAYEVALAGEPLGLAGVPSPRHFERAFQERDNLKQSFET